MYLNSKTSEIFERQNSAERVDIDYRSLMYRLLLRRAMVKLPTQVVLNISVIKYKVSFGIFICDLKKKL